MPRENGIIPPRLEIVEVHAEAGINQNVIRPFVAQIFSVKSIVEVVLIDKAGNAQD